MRRIVRLTRRYCASVNRLSPREEDAKAVGRTLRALADDDLPTELDLNTMVPPVLEFMFRRVENKNLWIIYELTETEVHLRALVNTPPIPYFPVEDG